MSLDVAKLEKVRELGGGGVQARCPACAEGGHDRSGEHLRIYPDGRFGCCVHPKDGEHRKRIFALVGSKGHGPAAGKVTLRIKTPSAVPVAWSVKAALTTFDGGTLGTAKGWSVSPTSQMTAGVESESAESGTLGTVEVKLRACAREDSTTTNIDKADFLGELKDLETVVPSVPLSLPPVTWEKLPFLTAGGDLSIPFDSPERYHWWKGGQSIAQTLAEVKERGKHAVTI